MSERLYTSNLGAGTGLIEESIVLLDLWVESMDRVKLLESVRNSGALSRMTDRRLKNIVYDQFAPRFLDGFGPPAKWLRILMDAGVPTYQIVPIMFLQTARANPILFDYVVQKYWLKYSSGTSALLFEDAVGFVMDAVDSGKTSVRWSEDFIRRRVAGYLNSTLADFGFLEAGRKADRDIVAPRITSFTANYLVHELHFSGKSDNGVLESKEWALWGMDSRDVIETLTLLSQDGCFIVQYSGDFMRVSWNYKSMEEFLDVVT